MAIQTASIEQRLTEENVNLRLQVADMKIELAAALLSDSSLRNGKLGSKIARQAKYLCSLNRRVRIQRLILRKLNELYPEIGDQVFAAAKDCFADELNDVVDIVV